MKNKTKIQIISTTLTPEQLKIRCSRVYGLRTANKIGDIETVNNTVLGLLNQNSPHIQYIVIKN